MFEEQNKRTYTKICLEKEIVLDNALIKNFFGWMKQEMDHHRIKEKLTGMSSVQYRIHVSQSVDRFMWAHLITF